MESLSKEYVPVPVPSPYVLAGESSVRFYKISPAYSPLQPPQGISFPPGSYTPTDPSLPVSDVPPSTPVPKFDETRLYRFPAQTTCPHCETQVTTQVTYRVGTYAWLMCLVFVLCGLLCGCCLIPFFVKHFKDAKHTCPFCQKDLHVHQKRCCE